jgi:hypothetical protein
MYFIFLLIDSPAFPPETGSENPNHIAPKGEPHGQNSAVDPAETVMPLLVRAMGEIFCNDAAQISKGELGHCERDAVLLLVFLILFEIPLEPDLCHSHRLPRSQQNGHTLIWA